MSMNFPSSSAVKVCSVTSCQKMLTGKDARGWCARHYKRWRLYGDPEAPVRFHGKTGTPVYTSWENMIARATNPRSPSFKYVGGRGITVCDRWRSFENFLADMGERPHGKTLDRIDTDGNYEPENCRWATPLDQVKNRRPYRRQKRE